MTQMYGAHPGWSKTKPIPQTAGIDKQYGWRFGEIITDGVELEDFTQYRNVDQGLDTEH